MRVLIDIVHPADINFFKNSIYKLIDDFDVSCELVALPRPGVIPIIERELPDIPFTSIGSYEKSLSGKVRCLLTRTRSILKYLNNNHIDVVTAFAGLGSSQAAFIKGIPSVVFTDDIEYKLSFLSFRYFASEIILPKCINIDGNNILKYNGFKELAYLHPNYFKPNINILDKYGIEPEKYVFIREVSKSSLNYRNLIEGRLSPICSFLNELGFDIILSLEDKKLTNLFETNCILLDEPVRDLYSLIYYAIFSISSGDTMARESCLLGTPTIYTGGRLMAVNSELERKGALFCVNYKNEDAIYGTVLEIINNNYKHKVRSKIFDSIESEYCDLTQMIVSEILSLGRFRKT